ncbi:GNAT family N-acetyltransferase [Sphingomonas canadensis]|uniref:GNAT family N-acetyltransferase n=1 Tax=Sphingomonas canadensis TaxID=1219257 RepID=A0ABW3H9R8_9SPHN|nr:GNAT family N-acetyltransferase [Sphingomonas canadensis]MCW3838010.1 GNAT family N-acetyltransferase [Sphingomonas canadensis]
MIETDRIILRKWRPADLDPFAAMCADPRVMATLGPVMTRDETAALIARVEDIGNRYGMTFWAMEQRADGTFLGWCGLKPGAAGTPIEQDMEIGWRLRYEVWGRGYAREAAQASLRWAWDNTGTASVAAITTPGNKRSWGLMERLNMDRAHGQDFDHPDVPDGSPLKRHITYRILRP